MSRYDLIVRSGRVVTEAAVGLADVAVADGRIVAVEILDASEHLASGVDLRSLSAA